MNREAHQLRPVLIGFESSHHKPRRANQRRDNPWLEKGQKSHWPSVFSLAWAVFHEWKGAANPRNVLCHICFQCACCHATWYTETRPSVWILFFFFFFNKLMRCEWIMMCINSGQAFLALSCRTTNHGQPIRDEIIPGLQWDKPDWPSVISLAWAIFNIWKGAARARHVLTRMCFQCTCFWYATLSSLLSRCTVRGDTTSMCEGCYWHLWTLEVLFQSCLSVIVA